MYYMKYQFLITIKSSFSTTVFNEQKKKIRRFKFASVLEKISMQKSIPIIISKIPKRLRRPRKPYFLTAEHTAFKHL